MSPTLTLNYYILGDEPNLINSVNVEALKTVRDLQEAIRAEETPRFNHIKARALVLWRVPVLDDETFDENISKLDFVDGASLRPPSILSRVFSNPLPPEGVHVVVKSPPQLILNYYILGDKFSLISSVSVEALENVRHLQEAIRAEETPRFDHVKAQALVLWRVSVPDDEIFGENISKLDLVDKASLWPPSKLSRVFPDPPDPEHVHIIVRPPPLSGNPVSLNCTGLLEVRRAEYMKAVPPAAPSTRARIQNFSELQNNPDHAIHCNRPQSASHPIPVTLLHPIFGQFADECETHAPTCEDNFLVLEMSRIMSAIYPDEESRQRGIFRLFERYDIPMHGSDIQDASYPTDVNITHRDFPLVIAKTENEGGSGSADPYVRAAFCYLESTREHWALKYPASPLPSIIVTIFGPYLSFAGAVWDHRPCVQVLSAAIPFHFHQSDIELKSMAARQLGAFRKAVQRLREYYIDIIPRLKNVPAPHDKLFPHPTRFASLVGPREDRDFRYSSRQSDEGFVFFGSLLSDNTDICIKFVRHYSSATHQYFADLGLAPRLLGFESLSGGWKMVVMDRVDREYMDLYSSTYDIDHPIDEELRIALYKTLYSSLAGLHKAGLVHGDIRAPNIMIPKNREAEFMLLDFDWAGEIGVARYPANVYRGYKLWRPDDVFDGAPIAAIHDMQMLDHIFTVEVPSTLGPKEMRLQLTSPSFASSQARPSKRSLTSGPSPEMRARKRRREETV